MRKFVSGRKGLSSALSAALTTLLVGVSPAAAQTPPPAPDGPPSIALVNPSAGYDPKLDPTGAEPPKVSDKQTPYQVVAWTSFTPQNALVELTLVYPDGTEYTIGLMERVGEHAWEYLWDIPDTLPGGEAMLTAYLYDVPYSGAVEIGSDTVAVEMRHASSVNTPDDPAPDETIELLDITPGGPIGFYKPPGGQWRTGIVGRTTVAQVPGRVEAFYSITPTGQKPVFRKCGVAKPPAFNAQDQRTHVVCTLALDDVPSKVTAIAAVVESTSDVSGQFAFNQEAAVAMPVDPYYQDPQKATLSLTQWARRLPDGCVGFSAFVLDPLGQPVVGANVDAHAVGPNDQMNFASGGEAIEAQGPEGHPSVSRTATCGSATENATGQEGRHRIPGAADEVHRESATGTGVSLIPGVRTGEWRFALRATDPGFTDVVAWIDGQPILKPDEAAAPDSDTLEEGEPVQRARAQWFEETPKLTLDPVGRLGAIGDCVPFTVKVRSRTTPVPGTNVDVHVKGPDNELDFCDPEGANVRRAPGQTPQFTSPHTNEDERESNHGSTTGMSTQHTEGEADELGNFTFGLSSGAVGDSMIVAWMDGEMGRDDDNQVGSEPSTTGTSSWGTGEPYIAFINPSEYGASTGRSGTGTQLPDNGATTVIRTRVFSLEPIEGVEIQLSSPAGIDPLGEAIQVGNTGIYELPWTVDVPDGSYTMQAVVKGTAVESEMNVTIGAGNAAPGAPRPSFERVSIVAPLAGTQAPFTRGAVTISGVATAGTETVDLFYTKVPAGSEAPKGGEWIDCGYVDLNGSGTNSQEFAGGCQLQGADQPGEVTGVAAIAFDCTVPGCDGRPDPVEPTPPATLPPSPFPSPAIPRAEGQKDSGDAMPIYGFEAFPLLRIEPAEEETPVVSGVCQGLAVVLTDQTGQPIDGENVDLHFMDPDGLALCDPGNATEWREPDVGEHRSSGLSAPSRGGYHDDPVTGARIYHVEAETTLNGRLVFGLTSPRLGDSSIMAWLDREDDDVLDPAEGTADGLLRWVKPRGCTITGTARREALRGTRLGDFICGRRGSDEIRGRRGADVLVGGPGADTLVGGPGRDVLRGGPGRDRCIGGPGKDRLSNC